MDKYTSPERQLLQVLAQAPKNIQPTLLKLSTNEGTSVTSTDAGLSLTIPFDNIQEILWQHQRAYRKDLTIALSILMGVAAITASVIILLRG